MAFQMIPPRVSSSPPPLDSLPSVACTGDDDEDEEFGSFSTHNTFDITGLSDKLPPTPDNSPSKFPSQVASGESSLKVAYDGISSATENYRHGSGDKCPGGEGFPSSSAEERTGSDSPNSFRVSDINGELIGSQNEKDDSGEFGDFSHFSGDNSTAVFSGKGVNDLSETKGGINSSHVYNEEGESGSDCPSDSANSFSVIATPPPLDHIADNVVIEDEFSRISPNPPPGHEEEFGDFEGCSFVSSTEENSKSMNNKRDDVTVCSRNAEKSILAESDSNDDCVESIQSSEGKNNDVSGVKQECEDQAQEISDGDIPDKEIPDVCGDVVRDDSEGEDDKSNDNEVSDSTSDLNGEENEIDEENLSTTKKCEEDNRTVALSETGDEVNKSFIGTSSIQSSVAQIVTDTDSNISEQYHEKLGSVSKGDYGEFTSSESEIKSASNSSIDDSTSIRTDGNFITDNSISNVGVHKDVDNARTLNRKNCVNNCTSSVELYVDDDDDFGEFNKAKDEEEDDLDFDDLREQVRNGTYGLEEESGTTADEFGEIYEYGGTCSIPDIQYDESDEFGDFGSAAAAVVEEIDEFGDFAAVGSDDDDDFGDFAAPDNQDVTIGVKVGDDQQGVFGDFPSQRSSDIPSQNLVFSWQDIPDTSYQKGSPVLKKLESLVLKWIPREPATGLSGGSQENRFVPTLFQSVEDDAFVWRHLENLEASAALTLSWSSMQAQTLYLSSVNVDARNILFGQKWSSSVPLFAQTLSFSPLTPAKPTENGATLDGGNRGSVTPPVMATTISPKLTSLNKEVNEVPIAAIDENGSEEQIPPAKFDWTSSGLINPLEGPGLEREFLSEGGEKGGGSRMKGPPTPSPLVQQILGSGMNRSPSAATPLQSMSSEAREVVEHLPDIGFMRSRVLMFPIRGDE